MHRTFRLAGPALAIAATAVLSNAAIETEPVLGASPAANNGHIDAS